MNLILTKDCAKQCSFCFTGVKDKDNEMDFNTIVKILDEFPEADIRLLGGEPTQYSRFNDVIDLLKSRNRPYYLISNLLFSKDVCNKILEYPPEWLMCNGMELNEKNRITLFNNNWDILKDHTQLDIAITLSESTDRDTIINYLEWLTTKLGRLQLIRIGLDLSGSYLINNKTVGGIINDIGGFMKTEALKEFPEYIDKYTNETNQNLIDHVFNPATLAYNLKFDCQIPPCIFDTSKPTLKFNYSGMSAICNKTAVDVFKGGTAIHCYPASDISIQNVFEHNTEMDIAKRLRGIYKTAEKNELIASECNECDYYLFSHCAGLCLGCRNTGITSHVIPISQI
jgi:organic radical activating enzyme